MRGKGAEPEDKRKHLEFIQGVINRMASNSFLFKGWSVTIIAAVSAFATKDDAPELMIIPIVSTLIFWFIDGYYLMLERAFRTLYNEVSSTHYSKIDYKMNIKKISFRSWIQVTFKRPVLWFFYGATLVLLSLLTFVINDYGLEVTITNGS